MIEKKSSISALQTNRQFLEDIFDLERRVLAPAASIQTSEVFQEAGGVLIPSPKRLDHQGLEEDALTPTVLEMGAGF